MNYEQFAEQLSQGKITSTLGTGAVYLMTISL